MSAMPAPHYLRFARALAMAGGLAGCSLASTPSDAGSDAARVDAFFDCTQCSCDESVIDSGLPLCPGLQVIHCGCAAVGPLAPPELAA